MRRTPRNRLALGLFADAAQGYARFVGERAVGEDLTSKVIGDVAEIGDLACVHGEARVTSGGVDDRAANF